MTFVYIDPYHRQVMRKINSLILWKEDLQIPVIYGVIISNPLEFAKGGQMKDLFWFSGN
jgi:hypothetical protein